MCTRHHGKHQDADRHGKQGQFKDSVDTYSIGLQPGARRGGLTANTRATLKLNDLTGNERKWAVYCRDDEGP